MAVARAGPDFDSARTKQWGRHLACRGKTGWKPVPLQTRAGGVLLQQQDREDRFALARFAVARAEVRSAAGKHFVARVPEREMARREHGRDVAVAGGTTRRAAGVRGFAELFAE